MCSVGGMGERAPYYRALCGAVKAYRVRARWYNARVSWDYDVIVAGAGPAGCAVAARLHARVPGLRVLVLERYHFPREKPCGGGLTGHVHEAMDELGMTLDVAHVPSHDARVRFGAFERVVALGRPVNIIRREDFDASLVAQARARGIDIREGEGVREISVDERAVSVTTSRGRTLRAQVLVGADGAASVVRKYLLRGEKALPHRLFKMELSVPAPGRADTAMLYDFTPMTHGLRGYLWVFPVPGERVNVGLMHYPAYRVAGPELITWLRRGLAELGIELPERGARGWPVWGYDPRKAIAGPRVLAVGDAAGIDGLTGEGIAVAMEHAIVAGDAIERAFAAGDFSFAGYRKAIRRAVVGRELALDRLMAHALYGMKGDHWWRFWLSLVLHDDAALELYAARVSGSQVLADHQGRLMRALSTHLVRCRRRMRELDAAVRG